MFLAMSTPVNIADLKNNLTQYLALVEQGAEVVVCKRNVPVARFEPLKAKAKHGNRSKPGSTKGSR
mgnify:CR=1 FL=1